MYPYPTPTARPVALGVPVAAMVAMISPFRPDGLLASRQFKKIARFGYGGGKIGFFYSFVSHLPMNRYLGTNPEVSIRGIREREPDWFKLADDVASFAGDLIYRLNVPQGDERLLLAALLYRRVAGAFEAVLALAERGMHTEGLSAHRSLLEALFVLGAIINQPDLVKVYLKNDEHRRRDIFKKIKKLSPTLRKALTPEFLPDVIEERLVELEASAKGATYMGVEQYAQAAKLHDIYLTDYSFLSEAAHHVAKDLERQIAVNAAGDVDGIYWGPESALPSSLLSPALEHMLVAAKATEILFAIGPSEDVVHLWQKAEEMFGHLAQ